MKKILIVLAVLTALLLSACGGPCEVHEYGQWEILQEGSCLENGLRNRVCGKCDAVEEEQLRAPGHSYGQITVVAEPTCTQEGVQSVNCTVCGAEEVAPIPSLEHAYGEWTVVLEPACLEAGLQTRVCVDCEGVEEAPIVATGHSFGDWKQVSAATCTADGQLSQSCTVCGQENTSSEPKLGHDFDPLYCSRCKESEYALSDLYKFYDTRDGLSVKVNSFTVTKRDGYNQYRVNWTIKNITENSEITHGMFRLYLSDGTWEQMYGTFPYMYYKESYTFYYDWKMLKDKEVLFVEYIPFDGERSSTPEEGAPRWPAP